MKKCEPLDNPFSVSYDEPLNNSLSEWASFVRHGTPNDTNDYYDVGNRPRIERFRLLAISPYFKCNVRELREKYGIPASGFIKRGDDFEAWAMKELSHDGRFAAWHEDIMKLLRRSSASPRWEGFFEHFILFNKESRVCCPRGFLISFASLDDMPRTIHLEIYKDTTIEEIRNQWRKIQEAQNILVDPYETKKTFGPGEWSICSAHPMVSAFGMADTTKKEAKKMAKTTTLKQFEKMLEMHERGDSYKKIAKDVFGGTGYYDKVGVYLNIIKKRIEENVLY